MQNALVIPCYNFAADLPSTLEKLENWHRGAGKDFFVCFVDDGSTDQTPKLLREFATAHSDWAFFESLQGNLGKGAAIRRGFALMQDKAENMVFTDCDLHYGLSIISERFLPALKESDVVIVDRSYKKQKWDSFLRKLASAVFNRCMAILTGVAYRDTQAGLKGFRVSSCRPLFEALTLNGFAFDVEILSLALFYRFRIEIISVILPPQGQTSGASTIGIFRSSLAMFMDLIRINLNWKRGVYGAPGLTARLESKVYLIKS